MELRNLNKRELTISLAITAKLSYEETQSMLRKYGIAELYARDRRDSIIIWAIYHKKDISEVNELCKQYNCGLVSEISEIVKSIKEKIEKENKDEKKK